NPLGTRHVSGSFGRSPPPEGGAGPTSPIRPLRATPSARAKLTHCNSAAFPVNWIRGRLRGDGTSSYPRTTGGTCPIAGGNQTNPRDGFDFNLSNLGAYFRQRYSACVPSSERIQPSCGSPQLQLAAACGSIAGSAPQQDMAQECGHGRPGARG